ncbi:MAG TPA: methyltransferase domain-containing protein [Vicinamibacteria bacterium]
MTLNHRLRGALGALVLGALAGPVLGSASEAQRLFAALGLKPGARVADVGAGDGEWAEHLAREVGESGHVFATEVDEADLSKIARRAREAGLANVTTILGSQTDTGLAAGCCDAILLRMVYHHFAEPAPMRQSLRAALRPGAPLVIVDTEPQGHWERLQGVPERGGHGIREEDLVREMTSDGFEVVARHADWSGDGDRYCVVFRRAPARVAGRTAG